MRENPKYQRWPRVYGVLGRIMWVSLTAGTIFNYGSLFAGGHAVGLLGVALCMLAAAAWVARLYIKDQQ